MKVLKDVELKSSDFRYLKTLGTSGTFGPVFKVACNHNGEYYALRIAPQRKAAEKEKLRNEVLFQMGWSHPNILRVNSFWMEAPEMDAWYCRIPIYSHMNEDIDHSFVLMEYSDSGVLKDLLNEHIPLGTVHDIIRGICGGLEYVHETQNSIHRNLKPENIFIFRGGDGSLIPKIGDFGYATYLDKRTQLSEGLVGSSYYMSPEKASGQPYGPESDIFSLGVIFFQCIEAVEKRYLTGDLGLDEISYNILPQEIMNQYPKEANLMTNMLAYKPEERPTAKKIIQILTSPEIKLPASNYESTFKKEFVNISRLPFSYYNPDGIGSCTYKAYEKDDPNTPWAIKMIELSQYSHKVQARSIVTTLSAINHQNILKYKKSWLEHPKNQRHRWEYPDYIPTDPNSKYIFIQMEFCEDGSLQDWLNNDISHSAMGSIIDQVQSLFLQMTQGLTTVHSANIIHRSLRPDSIYITKDKAGNKVAKIGSFQSARKAGRFMTLKGVPNPYQSPEMENAHYDLKSDVYSLGAIFYAMFLKALAIPDYFTTYILPLITSKGPRFPPGFEKEFPLEKELIEFMLTKDQEVRYSALQVLDWIKRHYAPEIVTKESQV